MATPKISTIIDELLDLLVSTPTPQQIIAFKPSESLQARITRLLERNRAGQLTSEEQRELDEYSRMNHFISTLKIHARKKLSS